MGAFIMRILKIALAASVALFCLMYALQNLFNLGPAFNFVQLMVGMEGHAVYPSSFGFAVTSPFVIGAMLGLIILLEILAGLLAAKGAFDLWKVRAASAEAFNAKKDYALLGAGLAVLIWFGIFSAIGGAYFQMWQTEAGSGALQGSFWYSMQNGLAWLMIRAADR